MLWSMSMSAARGTGRTLCTSQLCASLPGNRTEQEIPLCARQECKQVAMVKVLCTCREMLCTGMPARMFDASLAQGGGGPSGWCACMTAMSGTPGTSGNQRTTSCYKTHARVCICAADAAACPPGVRGQRCWEGGGSGSGRRTCAARVATGTSSHTSSHPGTRAHASASAAASAPLPPPPASESVREAAAPPAAVSAAPGAGTPAAAAPAAVTPAASPPAAPRAVLPAASGEHVVVVHSSAVG